MKRCPALIPASLLALALAACSPSPELEGEAATPVAPAEGSPAEAVPAAAQEQGIAVHGLWLRQPPPSSEVSAGYMMIENPGTYPDRLLAVETPAAERVEIHEMEEVDGMMRMRELEGGLEVPAGGDVELAPGGYHLMLMGVGEGLQAGQQVEAVLVFEQAGRVPVMFEVRPPGAAAAGEDDGHAHGH